MSDFHSLKINKLVKETADAASIYFDIPAHLAEAYKYLPGQYLTLEAMVNGEKVRRAYSLCTSPVTDNTPAVTVKRVDGGRMSNYLNDLTDIGTEIDVMVPNGKFTLQINENAQNHYVFFGGGSGITPLMAIMKTVLAKEQGSKITLVYCNRNEDSVIFGNTIEELSIANPNRLKVIHSYDAPISAWGGLTGYLTETKVADILSNQIGGSFYRMCQYYICGPTLMMDVVQSGLKAAGVAESNINTEYFTAPANSGEPAVEVEADEDFGGEATVILEVYGEEYTISCDEHKTILDAAIDQDIDPPYSCTVGVCTTCRAKLLKGRVEMKEREGLSDAEIAEGYILTCQSHPKSNNIELRFE